MPESNTPTPEPTDADIFRDAMAPEPAAPPAEPAPAPASPPAEGERPRDELGRFLPMGDDAPPQAAQPQAPQPPAEDDGPTIPPGRLREMREERDAAAARARELEFALYDMHQKMQAFQRQQETQKPAEAPQIPDVIADPAAYHEYVTQQFTEQLRKQEANFSFRMAHEREGELFEHAYGEMLGRAQRGDPAVVQWVMRSPDPGVAMVNWYKQERSLAQLGNKDPETWFMTQAEERLQKDEKFRAWTLERLRGATAAAQQQQAAQGNGGPVQLPPSLSRMPSSQPNSGGGDMSDSSLFDYAMREGRPRR